MHHFPYFRVANVLVIFLAVGVVSATDMKSEAAELIDLKDAVVVIRDGKLPQPERAAATVLIEEVETRTGIKWSESHQWPKDKPVIAATSKSEVPEWAPDSPVTHRQ